MIYMRYHKDYGQLVCGIPKKFKVYIKENLFLVVKNRRVYSFASETKIVSEYVNKHFYPLKQQTEIVNNMLSLVESL